jgi:hypothetical protein
MAGRDDRGICAHRVSVAIIGKPGAAQQLDVPPMLASAEYGSSGLAERPAGCAVIFQLQSKLVAPLARAAKSRLR